MKIRIPYLTRKTKVGIGGNEYSLCEDDNCYSLVTSYGTTLHTFEISKTQDNSYFLEIKTILDDGVNTSENTILCMTSVASLRDFLISYIQH